MGFLCVFKNLSIFLLPSADRSRRMGLCVHNPSLLPNAGEVLEVVTWIQEGGPKSRSAHGMLQESCLVPGHWGVLGGAGNEPYSSM